MSKTIKVLILILLITTLSGCTFWTDFKKDFASDTSGLDRVCTVNHNDGTKEVYSGLIRIDNSDGAMVHLLVDGKRYSFYYIELVCVEK